MPLVLWTDEAEAILADVESDETFNHLHAAGLRTFLNRDRRVPELRTRPGYDIVREIILPRRARLFYLHVPDSDEVIVLGFLLKGRPFTSKVLGRYFEPG
jgi:hypothetical protein